MTTGQFPLNRTFVFLSFCGNVTYSCEDQATPVQCHTCFRGRRHHTLSWGSVFGNKFYSGKRTIRFYGVQPKASNSYFRFFIRHTFSQLDEHSILLYLRWRDTSLSSISERLLLNFMDSHHCSKLGIEYPFLHVELHVFPG